MTKKIADEQRITMPQKRTRASPKSRKLRTKIIRPWTSLTEKISNLHLLLRVPGFARWPLQVRFFCEDVHQKWQRWNESVDASIRSSIKIILDVEQQGEALEYEETPVSTQAKAKRKRDAFGKGGIGGLDVGYEALKGHLDKSIFLLAEDEVKKCAVCSKDMVLAAKMMLVCPQGGCRAAFHMACLAAEFLKDEGTGGPIVPTSGRCPGCKAELQWVDLVKEMSLRARGEKEVAQLMKKPRERKAKVPKMSKSAAATMLAPAETDHSEDASETEADEDIGGEVATTAGAEDNPLPDDWHFQGNDEDDMNSVTSAASGFSHSMDVANPSKTSVAAPRFKTMIEDSDWDEAELLD